MMNGLYYCMISNLKNASKYRRSFISVPDTLFNRNILKILKNHGFIRHFMGDERRKFWIKVYLKYSRERSLLENIKVVSTPGNRKFFSRIKLYKYLVNKGSFVIVSTSTGLVTSHNSDFLEKLAIGGEVVLEVNL